MRNSYLKIGMLVTFIAHNPEWLDLDGNPVPNGNYTVRYVGYSPVRKKVYAELEGIHGQFWASELRSVAAIARQRTARRERDQAMRDLGLQRVRGSLGGTYWE